jgi:hypothetical protein
MTLRIFLWSNFFGMPWTVVKVLRPLRSVRLVSEIDLKRDATSRPWTGDGARREYWDVRHTLNADMDVGFLGLFGLSCVLVGVGEGIYKKEGSVSEAVVDMTHMTG